MKKHTNSYLSHHLARLRKKLNSKLLELKKQEKINENTYRYLHSTDAIPPAIRGSIKHHKANHPLRPFNYPLIKTHKPDNPARVITFGCGTPTENLSLFVETYCKLTLENIPCRVQDTRHMLDIIDKLNGEGIQDNDLLVSFDIINMFPSIDNETGIKIVRNKLCQSAHNFDIPVECIIDALEICRRRNCSTFRGQYWLQENGTAMGPKNSCSYANIVAENIDVQVLAACNVYPELRCWYRFRDDTFVLWRGTVERLQAFFHLLNTFDSCLQFANGYWWT